MQKCIFLASILLILDVLLSTSALSSVKVKLHDAATLPCNQTCSGRVTWTVSHKPDDILAQCNQTSCQSEEGFHMSHNQYLKGDLSLTITDVDYTKRTWYTCTCNSKDICDVSLQIEALSSSVQMKPGESLVLDLPISEPVQLIYNGTSAIASSSGQICTVDGHSLQCEPEYTRRVYLTSAIKLRGTAPPDAGVYIIRNTKNKEVIHMYTVSVEEDQPHPDRGQGAGVPVWVLTLLLLVLLVGSLMMNMWQWRTKQHLQNRFKLERTIKHKRSMKNGYI